MRACQGHRRHAELDFLKLEISLDVVNELESSRQVVITKPLSHLRLLEGLLLKEVVGSFDLVVASYIKGALTRGDASFSYRQQTSGWLATQ